MTKKKVTEQKHYCSKCGRELVFTTRQRKNGHSIKTGNPIVETDYIWACPKYYNFFGDHDMWRSSNPNFSDAIIIGKPFMQ